jgi:hypothetical protein
MCGGPVLIEGRSADGNEIRSSTGSVASFRPPVTVVYGMIEGIIPETHPNDRLRGMAAYVSAEDIQS